MSRTTARPGERAHATGTSRSSMCTPAPTACGSWPRSRTAGRYRLFLQFKTAGRVHTAAFTQEVA